VLRMIREWGADFIVHAGDFDYDDDPTKWEGVISQVFPSDYPYFATIGNHDVEAWETRPGRKGYLDFLTERLQRSGAAQYCRGEYGIFMACNYKGFLMVLSGAGTWGFEWEHTKVIEDTFTSVPALWRHCNWHKNQRLMQVGGKFDEVGWGVYEMCRYYGAIVGTGHEHSYCRSHTMSSFIGQRIADRNRDLVLRPERSHVWVSGLGGRSIRSYDANLQLNPWWAATAASNDNVSDGTLLCTFFIDRNPRKAHCDFRDRNGRVWDSYDMYSEHSATEPQPPPKTPLCFPKHVEIAATQHYSTVSGQDIFREPVVRVRSGRSVSLSFDARKELSQAAFSSVHLQVYGFANAEDANTEIEIGVRGYTHTMRWKEDEGWEKHEVWVSPDLTPLLSSVSDHTEGEIVFELRSVHATGVRFYTGDYDKCLLPHLVFQSDQCDEQ
jgi:hypothetical protein